VFCLIDELLFGTSLMIHCVAHFQTVNLKCPTAIVNSIAKCRTV